MRPIARHLMLVTVLAVLAYCGLVFFGESGEVLNALGNLDARLIGLGLFWATANYVIRFVRWEIYLRGLDIRVPLAASATTFFAGFAMSITPGKVGELLKSAMLKEQFDVPIARSAPVVVAERVTDLAGMALLIAWGGMTFPGGVLISAGSSLVVLGIVLVCLVPAVGRLLLRMCTVVPALKQRQDRLAEAYSALRVTSRPTLLIPATLLSVLSWGTHGVVLWLLAERYAQLDIDLTQSMFAYSAPLLAGTLALLPGGLGVTELSMAGILVTWSAAGADGGGDGVNAAAASVTIAVRGLTFWWAVLIGFAAFLLWRVRRRTIST